MLTFILLCLLVGSVVGFLAGLFGIGGGLIIVPTLVYLLPMVGVPDPLLMSTALGTSFATIVITGFSSILTLCNYLFITPIYFGGLWFTDVIGWATLESFIPGLPFDLGYGAAIAFVYLPFNAIKGLLVLGIYEMIAPRLLVALQKILKNLKLSPVVSE